MLQHGDFPVKTTKDRWGRGKIVKIGNLSEILMLSLNFVLIFLDMFQYGYISAHSRPVANQIGFFLSQNPFWFANRTYGCGILMACHIKRD